MLQATDSANVYIYEEEKRKGKLVDVGFRWMSHLCLINMNGKHMHCWEGGEVWLLLEIRGEIT